MSSPEYRKADVSIVFSIPSTDVFSTTECALFASINNILGFAFYAWAGSSTGHHVVALLSR